MQHTHGGIFMLPTKRFIRAVSLGLLLSTAPVLAVGCFGRFPLTKAVYRFNGSVFDGKWGKTILFWVFWILPVYDLAMLIDALVINLVEFWSGDSVQASSYTDPNGNTVALVPSDDGREVTLTVSRDGKVLSRAHIVKTTDTTFEIRDIDEKVTAGVVRTPTGDLLLNNADGVTLKRLPAKELAAVLAK